PQEPVKAIVRLWEECFKDEEMTTGLGKVNQLIWLDYSQDGKDCGIWIDCRDGKLAAGGGKPSEEPDLTMSLSADNAHLTWLNKLNPVQAIAQKKILVKGSASGLLKLAPKLPKVAKIYVQVLKDLGWEDKVV
ncbi:MAG TPA: SCP2 sterol-binding domain-containing protein, partial [Desulfomonilia bacterium]|nr:SCP2 sterol-binding domain-containing protein [Desulfomonilia bacterium]